MYIPLFPFFVSLLIVAFIVFRSIVNDKFSQIPFIASVVNAVGFLAYIPFYNQYINVVWFKYLFITHISLVAFITLLIVYLTFRRELFLRIHYRIFMSSMIKTRWNAYYVIDRKGRVNEISDGFLEEIGFSRSEVIGKPLFDVLNRSIRITSFDGVETNNRSVEAFYDDYQKTVKKGQFDEHTILFQNHKGTPVILHTVEQPIYFMGKYRGRINVGEKQSDFNLVGIERELKLEKANFESLRLKYAATLEIVDEGLYFIDLDERYLWGSDTFIKMLGLNDNMINFEDYQKYIFEDDINQYLGTLSSLTRKKETFKTRYRFLINGKYIWVTDKGKRIFEDRQSNIIIGTLNKSTTSGFSREGLEALDSLKTGEELHYHLSRLLEDKRTFQLALFELSNIPEVNETYGRNLGNMLMNEYVKKLQSTFLSESSEMFRLTGLVFAVTIVDPRKMDILRKGVLSNKEFLNLKMGYGSIQTELEVLLGVSTSYKDSNDPDKLLEYAHQALGLARHKDFQSNVCYYHDING